MQLNRVMINDHRQNDRDRELFSELIEPPIPPHLIQVVPPFLEESNPVYMIQMSGEAAWKCREFYWMPRRVYDSFQASILPLGYKLNESSCDRVGRTVGENIRKFKRKMDSITSGKQRQKVRAETWVKITKWCDGKGDEKRTTTFRPQLKKIPPSYTIQRVRDFPTMVNT